MHNIKLTLAYDGKAYFGWQKNDHHKTIESTLQPLIEKILQHSVKLQAASRTDAGVHANGQVINFFSKKQSLDLDRFLFSLNRLLPKDIAALSIEEVEENFHPTIDCLGKEYYYYICLGLKQLPFHRYYSWHVPYSLNFDEMEKACSFFIGKQDFQTFCNVKTNQNYVNCVREIQTLQIDKLNDNRLLFKVKGHHFLYKMVRNMVGTLVDIGKGKLSSSDLPFIFKQKSRPEAGVCAPAHGLFLHQVFYP